MSETIPILPISHSASQRVVKVRRDYNSWVASETMEDYALRYTPQRFRKWSPWRVANTAFGLFNFNGRYTNNGFADFLLGYPVQATRSTGKYSGPPGIRSTGTLKLYPRPACTGRR